MTAFIDWLDAEGVFAELSGDGVEALSTRFGPPAAVTIDVPGRGLVTYRPDPYQPPASDPAIDRIAGILRDARR